MVNLHENYCDYKESQGCKCSTLMQYPLFHYDVWIQPWWVTRPGFIDTHVMLTALQGGSDWDILLLICLAQFTYNFLGENDVGNTVSFIDLRKAVDLVDYSWKNLEYYGVKNKTLYWIKNSLRDL